MIKKRALLSVFDKTGIVNLAQGLHDLGLGFELVSSGGTKDAIADAEIPVLDVSEVTGFPESLDGRLKTLHPKIHGGLLGIPTNQDHVKQMAALGIESFVLSVNNLYPFQQKVAEGASRDEIIENIDIGGPAMIRAAAKNHAFVAVVTDPSDYDRILDELNRNGEISDETRAELAVKAFAYTAAYDIAIVEWLSEGAYAGTIGKKVAECDYGENRWQSPAALYKTVGNDDSLGVPSFKVVAGRDPSFINWTDVDRQLFTVTHMMAGLQENNGAPVNVANAVKHGNSCGAAFGATPEEALRGMLNGDPLAVFGAVVMVNFPITGELIYLLQRYASQGKRLLDGLCAPSFDEAATNTPLRKDGKYFLATNPALNDLSGASLDRERLLRPVRGGFLVQPNYTNIINLDKATLNGVLGNRTRGDLVLGLAVCSTSSSNTVSLIKGGRLIGNGVGQQDRKACCELAVEKARRAGHDVKGAVAVSDSFFPFPDGPEILINAGVGTIFSTTGSKKDAATQELCRERGVTLVQLPDAEARMFFRH